jgi:arginine N-succinyltransferase
MLLARSRYLFIRRHRARFATRLIAELRGVIDESGGSPFWDGIAGRFFGMSFQQADEFNATHGTQFIADLMPKTPIYAAMLSDSARAVIGVPHPSGRAAMRMLEREGFVHESYIDIFDGGPTMVVNTDDIRTVREAREAAIAEVADSAEAVTELVTAGRLHDFAACYGRVGTNEDGSILLDSGAASRLGVKAGDKVLAVQR